MEKFSDSIAIYKSQLKDENIQKAYSGLMKYVFTLKSHLSKVLSDKYYFGNVSPGYLDYTYFPFFNKYLRESKLRFGIILNHQEMRFELWLMGQNAKVQKEYWNLLKSTKWSKDNMIMPKYSIVEVILADNPDFDRLDILTQEIKKNALLISDEIIEYLKNN